MSNDSLDVRLARLDERMKTLADQRGDIIMSHEKRFEESAKDRASIRAEIKELTVLIDHRLQKIEGYLTEHRTREAERTRTGRFIYLLGGGIISFLVLDWKDGWSKLSSLLFATH